MPQLQPKSQYDGYRYRGDDGYRYGGDYRVYRGARAEHRIHDRGWHRGWEHRGDRVTIIKRHRNDWDD